MKKNVILIIVCVLILTVGIIYMPNIYKSSMGKNDDVKYSNEITDNNSTNSNEDDKITKDSDIISELVYPVMHNDISKKDNYYTLSKFTYSSLSNNDILYNAFLQIYSGYLVNAGKGKCTDNSFTFDANYLRLRIENIFGPSSKYTLDDFIVPTGSMSDYIGSFTLNNDSYTYNGSCEKNTQDTMYYDVKSLIDVNTSNNDNDLMLQFYVGFVKVNNNSYTLYRDFYYKTEIGSGKFTSFEDIEKNLSTMNVAKYQYTFRKDICNYDNYCFYEGEWLND